MTGPSGPNHIWLDSYNGTPNIKTPTNVVNVVPVGSPKNGPPLPVALGGTAKGASINRDSYYS